MARATLAHGGKCCTSHCNETKYIGFKQFSVALFVSLLNRRDVTITGVVDQYINAAVLSHRFNDSGNVGFVGNVQSQSRCVVMTRDENL